ncbi:MAG: hypothetical protein UY23_C0001G0039 [Candidatus Jorgensenbacteria bacterium GW2011_GWA1_48_11]|uniref:Transcriptional repressor PaaX-like central Cas2-like domain-containing protein n=1 Tax=Candidatus Jorgensenbacteria bacterium GW2011_GWA1_48_11 TaxID=1618660 RepID=A0A0G1WM67_9BACT|nr:MAG: hypothetical protein UY23_C0001G0039 [Candidatus Jorgensenbacteria bacterium GW2011_GWA1_48_11]KKW11927.1 MAG: hypothetical protein UY51_C0005G0169 [Candidatus Jorgensenbacteria bacterium GW2011_GWB1_49_9]
MKGDLTFKILRTIDNSISATANIIDVVTSGYQDSYRKMRSERFSESSSAINKLKEKQRFYNILYYLQKQNLITKDDKSKSNWLITKKGKGKLESLKKLFSQKLPIKNYPIHKSNNLIIISFDIPEVYKKKRRWLRSILLGFGYKMIQKSVWLGHNALPSAFLKDLRDYNLMNCVQIFSIHKSGTISS